MNLKQALLIGTSLLSINFAYANGFTVPADLSYPPNNISSGAVTSQLQGSKPAIAKIMIEGHAAVGESLSVDFTDLAQYQFTDLDQDVDLSPITFDWYCFTDAPYILLAELQSASPPDLTTLIAASRAKKLTGTVDTGNPVSMLTITQFLLDDPECQYIGFAITPQSETGYPNRVNNTLIVPSINYIGSMDNQGNPSYQPTSTGKPQISDLQLAGQIRDGFVLTASYNFAPDPDDQQPRNRSVFSVGTQGSTVAEIATSTTPAGDVQVLGANSFDLPPLSSDQINTIVEVSVIAKDGRNVVGNTLTVDTDMPEANGNNVVGLPVTFEFNVEPNSIVANNTDLATLTLIPKDKFGKFVPNLTTAEIGLGILNSSNTAPEPSKITAGNFVEQNDIYTSTIKGTLAGTYKLLPTYNAQPLGLALQKTVTLVAGPVSTANSTISLSNFSYYTMGNNAKTGTLTATLKDGFGNPVSNVDVNTFKISPNATFSPISGSASSLVSKTKTNDPIQVGTLTNWTHTNNVYKATYAAGQYSGDIQFILALGNIDIKANGTSLLNVYVDANPNTAKVDTVELGSNQLVIANSNDSYLLNVLASDKFGNQFVMQDGGGFDLSIPPTVDPQAATVVANSAGNYANNGILNVLVSGKKVGETNVTFTPSKNSAGALTIPLKFIGDISSGQLQFSGSNLYNTNENVTYLVSYKDKFGNNLTDGVNFTLDNGANIVSINGELGTSSFSFDGSSETIPVVITSSTVGSYTLSGISAQTGQNIGNQVIEFRSPIDGTHFSRIVVNQSPVIANGSAVQTVVATVIDKHGNPITGSDVVAKLTISDEFSTWVNSTKTDTNKTNKSLELSPDSSGNITFYLSGYSVGEIPFHLELSAYDQTLDSNDNHVRFTLWLLDATGNTKSMYGKQWAANTAQPRNIVSVGETGNIIVPAESGVAPGEYTYSFVTSSTNLTPVPAPSWLTLDSSTGLVRMNTGQNAPHLNVNGFPTTLFVYAKYNGVGRADRIWRWTPKRAWKYIKTALDIGNKNCVSPMLYPTMAVGMDFSIEWRETQANAMFRVASNTTSDRNIKYFARDTNASLGFYYATDTNSRIISSSNTTGARGFTSKSAQIWCTNQY